MANIFDTSEKLQIKLSGNAHISCHVLLNTLKGTAMTLPEVILYYSTLSGTNWQILTPKRYGEYPRHFYRGVPPGLRAPVKPPDLPTGHKKPELLHCNIVFNNI